MAMTEEDDVTHRPQRPSRTTQRAGHNKRGSRRSKSGRSSEGQWRSQPMPPGWAKTRARILDRDQHRCAVVGCTTAATHVDHIVPVVLGGTEDDSNLQSMCAAHHRSKTGRENAARTNEQRPKRKRPPEQHPGFL
jgi:5-methylcytosine-specific restriction endonuclease McrA